MVISKTQWKLLTLSVALYFVLASNWNWLLAFWHFQKWISKIVDFIIHGKNDEQPKPLSQDIKWYVRFWQTIWLCRRRRCTHPPKSEWKITQFQMSFVFFVIYLPQCNHIFVYHIVCFNVWFKSPLKWAAHKSCARYFVKCIQLIWLLVVVMWMVPFHCHHYRNLYLAPTVFFYSLFGICSAVTPNYLIVHCMACADVCLQWLHWNVKNKTKQNKGVRKQPSFWVVLSISRAQQHTRDNVHRHSRIVRIYLSVEFSLKIMAHKELNSRRTHKHLWRQLPIFFSMPKNIKFHSIILMGFNFPKWARDIR